MTPLSRDLLTNGSGLAPVQQNPAPSTPAREPVRVLVVEPHPTLRTVLVQRLRQDGHLTAAVASSAEAIELCQDQSPDLLISAEILEKSSALRLGQQLRPMRPSGAMAQR